MLEVIKWPKLSAMAQAPSGLLLLTPMYNYLIAVAWPLRSDVLEIIIFKVIINIIKFAYID